jgi:hypothetical protein
VLAAVDRGGRVYVVTPLFGVSVSYIYRALARRQRDGIATIMLSMGKLTLEQAGCSRQEAYQAAVAPKASSCR